MHSTDNWLEITQQHLDSISDHKIDLEVVYDPAGSDYILYTRTIFEDEPDPVKRPRMQAWSIKQLASMGDTTPGHIANRVHSTWKFARAQHVARLPKKECECNLGGAHETWCHRWEAY